jgi:GntR family transcriptional repressor for pyruvate dehydrogenase complex
MEAIQFQNIGNKNRLVDRVVSEIQEMIIDNRLQPGLKLPPERFLAEQLGVSRTVTREAVHMLVTKGLLETRHGVGTIVCKVGGEQIAESLNFLLRTRGFTLDDLHQVRSILEVENAGLAADKSNTDEIEQLAEVVASMEHAMADPLAFAACDARFHHVLAQMSHNPLLVLILDLLGGLIQEVRLTVSKYPELFATVMPDHKQILEHIKSHNVQEARMSMQAHLNHARLIQDRFPTK